MIVMFLWRCHNDDSARFFLKYVSLAQELITFGLLSDLMHSKLFISHVNLIGVLKSFFSYTKIVMYVVKIKQML